MIVKTSIIKKLKSGKYRLYSRKKDQSGNRRNLGTYDSLSGAKEREKQVQYFKHHAEDGAADDKQTKMLGELSNIATYLEEAGFIDKADKVYAVMSAIDGSLAEDEDYLLDPFLIPDDQRNIENQGFGGGESPIGGGYAGLGVDEAMRSEDGIEQDNVDIAARNNGLMGNSTTDNQNAGGFQGFSDAYFYRGYGNLEGIYGPQDR
jgi:hypothetical protein